jgi:hypothetical protein
MALLLILCRRCEIHANVFQIPLIEGNLGCKFVFVGCVWILVDDGMSSVGAVY